MLTNKAYDLDSAIEAIAPAVGPNTAVMPLLNGMSHIDVLEAKFGAGRVVGGVARIGVALSPEGEIRHTSPFAAFSFGERDGKPARPALVELGAAIKKAGLDGGVHANIVQDLWDKWVFLCTLAALCCLMRGTSGDILEAAEGQAIVEETVEECRKVAAASGHDPRHKGWDSRGNPDPEGLAVRCLHAARPGKGLDGRSRPCRGRHDRAREKGRRCHAQPAARPCPSAGLSGAPRPRRHRQTGLVTVAGPG